MSDSHTSSDQKQGQIDLIYGLNDRPKPLIAFFAALQHLLAIIVPIVTPGLLICLALGVSPQDTNMILSMSLVISGVATFLQCKKIGPFGAGLLIVQGTSFNFIGPMIGIGSAMVAAGTPVEAVMASIFGVVIAGLKDAPLIQIPTPMHFGISFSWSLFIPMAFIYLVTSLEAIGDVTATSKISNQPVDGPVWMERIKGGVLVNGANSFLAGLFNTFPSSVFAQNNGVIQLTGVASRFVGIWIAIMLIILGLFPAVAGIIQAVPQAVLGGAVMVMFGAVAASGINILSGIQLDRRALLIIAISLALGLGVAQVPQILEHLPELPRNIFSSGVATGGLAALILNLVLPETKK
ncbi:hypothetical protein FQR65_LT16846 [Abscondita terminalis]|nr:hypothetical protein FQR65_LT16846 [Abscondita terminalis]